MLGSSRLVGALTALVKRTRADGVSVSAHAKTCRVFRFAYDAVHQDLVQESISTAVQVVRDQRVGVARTGTLSPRGLRRCAEAAADIAAHAPRCSTLPVLPARHRIASTRDWVAATSDLDAAHAVSALKRLFHLCQGAGATLAGSFVTAEDEFAVANSAGTACYAASSVAGAKLVTMFGPLSGYASGVHRDVRRLDLTGLLKRSLAQSLHPDQPQAIPLGTCEVILEPEAVAELVTWLGSIAFGAKSLEERTSFLAGRMGERVMAPAITIYDDGREPGTLRVPFDFEGVPKRNTLLVDRGIASGAVYDSVYGARFGRASTGHAMPPDEVEGPLPLHLAMRPGKSSLAQMVRSCRRGLLIPRFHYVNGLLNPREALMTGLTREGVFLIERGRLTKPVKTLRFTQSLLEAFSRVKAVSRERRLVAEPSQELGCALMPALHLAAFNFTGRSES